MCDDVEVEVWMHGRQGCLVACVRTEPGAEKVVLSRQMQPDVAPEHWTQRTHKTHSPHYETHDTTPLYLTQDAILLMQPGSCVIQGRKERQRVQPGLE